VASRSQVFLIPFLWLLAAIAGAQDRSHLVIDALCWDSLPRDGLQHCRITLEDWFVGAPAPRVLSHTRRLLSAAGFTLVAEESTTTGVRLVTSSQFPAAYCDPAKHLALPTAAVLVAAQARKRETEVLVVVDGTGRRDSKELRPALRVAFCTIGSVKALLDSSLATDPR